MDTDSWRNHTDFFVFPVVKMTVVFHGQVGAMADNRSANFDP